VIEKRSAIQDAMKYAKLLFMRGMVTGSTGNISFRVGDAMLISGSGSCFGMLAEDSFACVTSAGGILEGHPSKEWPLHLAVYKSNSEYGAVIHAHSHYSVLFSCLRGINDNVKKLFAYTPYLAMRTGGRVVCVPYHRPGSEELFRAFDARVKGNCRVYVLQNHGVIAAGKDVADAFMVLEEFEATARIMKDICGYVENDYVCIG